MSEDLYTFFVVLLLNLLLVVFSRKCIFIHIFIFISALELIPILSLYSEPGHPGRVSVLKMFLYIVIK